MMVPIGFQPGQLGLIFQKTISQIRNFIMIMLPMERLPIRVFIYRVCMETLPTMWLNRFWAVVRFNLMATQIIRQLQEPFQAICSKRAEMGSGIIIPVAPQPIGRSVATHLKVSCFLPGTLREQTGTVNQLISGTGWLLTETVSENLPLPITQFKRV